MTAAWSAHNPNLQLAWDATSWGQLQKCPRKYQLGTIEGWRQPENPHLDFGSMAGEAMEVFQLRRIAGDSKHEATKAALLRALQISGWYDEGEGSEGYRWTPWGGDYVERWRCTGTEPYMEDGKKSKKKCPYSHVGKWFLMDDPALFKGCLSCKWRCEACGSAAGLATHYLPDHPSKHRENLIRLVAHACDEQPDTGGLQPYVFPDGTPAIELSLVMPMGRKAPGGAYEICPNCEEGGVLPAECDQPDCEDGYICVEDPEDYLLVANFDEINTWRERQYITDNKTTSQALNDYYFGQFVPNAQFDFYDLMGSIGLPGLDLAGLAVRAMQATKETTDVQIRRITKTPGQRKEAWRDLNHWITLAEGYAAEGYWPMNRSACQGCEFRAVCDMDPEYREDTLRDNFENRGAWDPLERPGRRNVADIAPEPLDIATADTTS